MSFCVYVIRFDNGKLYVGVSSRLKSRLLEHRRTSTSLVGRAMASHYWTCEVVFEGSAEECFSEEVRRIVLLDTKHPRGYNLTDGGEGSVNLEPSVRASIARKTKARMSNPAAREKVVEGNLRRWTPERREAQSALMKARYSDPEQRLAQAERVRKSINDDERSRRSAQALKNWADPTCAEAMMKRSGK